MQTRLRSVLALVVIAVGMSLALVPTGAQAAPVKPKVGQCHQLTPAQAGALADPKRPVSCTSRHNTQTYAVVTTSASFATMTEEQISATGRSICDARWSKAIGGTVSKRAQSAFTWVFFAPTPAQIVAGHNWIRCDIALQHGERLQSLPKLSRPVLSGALTDRFRLCLTARLDETTCNKKHVYRSISAIPVRGAAHPGEERLYEIASARCPRGWNYATWPTELGWPVYEHAVTCFDKTRR